MNKLAKDKGKNIESTDESTDINAQRGTMLGLAAKQVEIAIILADPSDTRTITQMCKDENVPRRTFYNWMSKPEFREFINSMIDNYSDAVLPGVWKALSRKAESGDTTAIKLFFEMKGKYREVKDVNHNFNNVSEEDMEQRIRELTSKLDETE